MDEITMYEVTHKSKIFIPNGRTAIFVGNSNNESNYLRDNTGENIAKKNKNYCELTAVYWIWKNDKSSKFVSIEHYRRFFMDPVMPRIISQNQLLKYLMKYDAITTRLYNFPETVREYYGKKHFRSDIEVIGKIINDKCPEYSKAYEEVLSGTVSAMCNMVAMNKMQFDRYCKWLFDILFEFEKQNDITERNNYQKRVYGFLSERLMNVWLLNQDLKIKRLPIYYYESQKVVSVIKSLKHRR